MNNNIIKKQFGSIGGNFDVVPQYNVFKQKYSSEEKLLLSELRENLVDLAISSDESLQVNEDKLLNDIKNFLFAKLANNSQNNDISNEYLDKIYADDNTSVVTSGSYQRYYTVNGKDYCHIIDKNTLYPANYFKSVTVISSDSALADTLSTALFCMDLNAGRKLAEKYNIQVIWLDKNNKITKTDGVKSAK